MKLLRTNLATNPSFESGSTGMGGAANPAGSATIGLSSEWVGSGTQALKVTGNGTIDYSGAYPWGGLGASVLARMGLVAGKTYTVSVDFHQTAIQASPWPVVARGIWFGPTGSTGDMWAKAEAPNVIGTSRIKCTFTIPAGTTQMNAVFTLGTRTGSGYYDRVLIEEGITSGEYFDGNTSNTGSRSYAWSGTPNGSASTESGIAISAVPLMTDPTDRVRVTVEGLAATEQLVTVWRRWDSEREAVSGARRISVVDSFYIDDFKAPLQRAITYELEVLSGPHAGVQGVTAASFLASTSGWISDPLAPSMSVRVNGIKVGDETYFRSEAFTKIGRHAKVNNFDIMGASRPVSLGGIRQAASGIPLSMTTTAEAENVRLRDMVNGTAHLIIRPLPEWGSFLPGTATYAAGDMDEIPMDVAMGGSLTRWESTGDVVRGSSARVLIALWTYQQVAEIFASYDQKQAAAGGGTYLDDQKNPANG